MSEILSAGAAELTAWFGSVQRLTEFSLFAAAPEGPLRDAVVLDVLRRNARIVSQATLDISGALYSPLCFFLAAACRHLRASLGVGHWRAALENVGNLRSGAPGTRQELAAYGLDSGTPATIFKTYFEEAVRQAGLTEGATFLSKQDREVAVGLAVNWAMRLLLAYSLDVEPRPDGAPRKDLAWVAERARQALEVRGTASDLHRPRTVESPPSTPTT